MSDDKPSRTKVALPSEAEIRNSALQLIKDWEEDFTHGISLSKIAETQLISRIEKRWVALKNHLSNTKAAQPSRWPSSKETPDEK